MKVYGPYKRKNDEYQHVVIIHDDGRRQTVSLQKYIWEQAYGPVEEGFDIHHIDENPDNNVLENLEKKEVSKHRSEHSAKYFGEYAICIGCGKKFWLSPDKQKRRKSNAKRGKVGPFCSNSCVGIYGKEIQLGGMPQLAVRDRT